MNRINNSERRRRHQSNVQRFAQSWIDAPEHFSWRDLRAEYGAPMVRDVRRELDRII